MPKEIKIISDQNLIDFTLQYTGSVKGLFDIIALNEGIGVNSILRAGNVLLVPDTFSDENIGNYYETNNIVVTTGELEPVGDFNNDFNNDFSL